MLGGSNCKVGGKKVAKKGGSECGRLNGGKKKVVKKVAKKVAKKRPRGGGLCIGNLHPFDDSNNNDSGSSAPAPAPSPAPMPPTMGNDITGGAKKRKSGKSRKAGPYAKFVKKHFASVKMKNPKFKATDCIKEIAKMWKAQKK